MTEIDKFFSSRTVVFDIMAALNRESPDMSDRLLLQPVCMPFRKLSRITHSNIPGLISHRLLRHLEAHNSLFVALGVILLEARARFVQGTEIRDDNALPWT